MCRRTRDGTAKSNKPMITEGEHWSIETNSVCSLLTLRLFTFVYFFLRTFASYARFIYYSSFAAVSSRINDSPLFQSFDHASFSLFLCRLTLSNFFGLNCTLDSVRYGPKKWWKEYSRQAPILLWIQFIYVSASSCVTGSKNECWKYSERIDFENFILE